MVYLNRRDAGIIISLSFQGCIHLQPSLSQHHHNYHISLSTTQPLSHLYTGQFCFLTHPKAGMFPTDHGYCACVSITHSYIHPHRHRRSIQFHLLTFDLWNVDNSLYQTCTALRYIRHYTVHEVLM